MRATLKLGITTTTADAEGDVIETREVNVTRAQLQAACERFTGPIRQVPPMHSALKRDGVIVLDGKRGISVPDFDRLMEETGDDTDGAMLS